MYSISYIANLPYSIAIVTISMYLFRSVDCYKRLTGSWDTDLEEEDEDSSEQVNNMNRLYFVSKLFIFSVAFIQIVWVNFGTIPFLSLIIKLFLLTMVVNVFINFFFKFLFF